MRKFFKDNKKTLICIFVCFIIFAILLALVLDAVMRIPAKTSWEPEHWASFLGSYIGGIATLFAVFITIQYNRFEQNERLEREKAQKIMKRATVIYYDFKFAFLDILKLAKISTFLTLFSQANGINASENLSVLDYCKPVLTQLYIDPDWIQNVAELCESSKFLSADISDIYSIYGELNTIQRWASAANVSYIAAWTSICHIIYYTDRSGVELLPNVDRIFKKIAQTADIEIEDKPTHRTGDGSLSCREKSD